MSDPTKGGDTAHGLGRPLIACYGILALAATGRSAAQLLTKASEAPLAYSLSAVAAVVYIVATILLARPSPRNTRWARSAIGFEAVGVYGVGVLTVLDPGLFPDATVWSDFGVGYAFLPAVLPLLGLWWIRHVSSRATDDDGVTG